MVSKIILYYVFDSMVMSFVSGLTLFGLNEAGAMTWFDTSLIQLLVFSALIVAVDPVAVCII